MGKPRKQDDQYRLPLDPPSNGSSGHNSLSNQRKAQNGDNSCKVFSFASAIQKREAEREGDVLQRILAHSASLEW